MWGLLVFPILCFQLCLIGICKSFDTAWAFFCRLYLYNSCSTGRTVCLSTESSWINVCEDGNILIFPFDHHFFIAVTTNFREDTDMLVDSPFHCSNAPEFHQISIGIPLILCSGWYRWFFFSLAEEATEVTICRHFMYRKVTLRRICLLKLYEYLFMF